MKRLKIIILLIGMLHSVSCFSMNQISKDTIVEFFVSPGGKDSNNGTIENPYATLERAAEQVRSLLPDMSNDIVINIRGGVYALDKPISLGAKDSGKNGHKVYYRAFFGETPVFSGGKEVANWQVFSQSKKIYRSYIGKGMVFRQLYVNGQRATRAKGSPEAFGIEVKDSLLVASNLALADWKNQDQIELVCNREWSQNRALVSKIVRAGDRCVFNMKEPNYTYLKTLHSMVYFDKPSFIENALELLDEAGEWYYDSNNGYVYYKPLPETDIYKSKIFYSVLENLVTVKGILGNPVTNIVFDGLKFVYSNWSEPSKNGFASIQANQLMNWKGRDLAKDVSPIAASIQVEYGQDIQFENCSFTGLGNCGVDLRHTQNCSINKCLFSDISGNAIQVLGFVDEPFPDQEQKICKDNLISNNLITDVSKEFTGGVAIMVGYAQNTIISHNEICNIPYTAISIGWGWGQKSMSKGNRVEFNYIHDYMREMRDGAAVYTLGPQPGSVCSNNYICRMIRKNWGGGMYFDEGSSGYTVNDNVVDDVLNWLFFNRANQISVNGNYSTNTSLLSIRSTDCNVNNTCSVYDGIWPAKAIEIIQKAGIEKSGNEK